MPSNQKMLRNDFGNWRGEFFELNAPESLLTDNLLMRLSALNKGVRMERTADGRLTCLPPVGAIYSNLNAKLTGRLGQWDETAGLGMGFGSCVGFHLPNSAVLSPDISWLRQDRWDVLTKKQQEGFAPLCPDFVGEIVSPPQTVGELQAKMREYIENGAKLGWLIGPQTHRIEIYRVGQGVEILDNPVSLSGEDVLPGFVLNLQGMLF